MTKEVESKWHQNNQLLMETCHVPLYLIKVITKDATLSFWQVFNLN